MQASAIKYSILIAPEKNTKELARTMFSIMTKTKSIKDCEIIIGTYKDETENRDLQAFFMAIAALQYNGVFQFQPLDDVEGVDAKLNRLAEYSLGQWIIPLKDGDHFTESQWDEHFMDEQNGSPSLVFRYKTVNNFMYGVSRELYNQKFVVAPREDLEK